MVNNFTKEEIKKSVEYGWRKQQAMIFLFVILIIVVITLFIVLVSCLNYILLGLQIWIGITLLYSLIFGPFALYYLYKMRYLLKNYSKFNSYEVMLDNVSTSIWYRGAVYYTVSIVDNGRRVSVDTNPYFSNMVFSKFILGDYNNKKVIGLYDSNIEKFYIIKRVD